MKRGFTLIELLIVIAILAVLSTVVVLVLNPAELLRQARDSSRISDLGSINSAIALYLADVASPSWLGSGTTPRCTSGAETVITGTTCTAWATTTVDGNGWVGINFGSISTGSPLSRLPLDPVNDSTNSVCGGSPDGCYYGFYASTTMGKYRLFANMESVKFGSGGGSDVESNSKDGGTVGTWYEIGSQMSGL